MSNVQVGRLLGIRTKLVDLQRDILNIYLPNQ